MFRAIGPSGPESQAFPIRGSHFNRRLRALTAAGAGEIIPASFRLQEVGGGGCCSSGGGIFVCGRQNDRRVWEIPEKSGWHVGGEGGGGGGYV